MLAQARQVHHEGLFERSVHVFLNAFKQYVFCTFFKFACQIVFPVRTPFHFVHFFAGEHRDRTGGRRRFHFRRVLQMLVIVGEWLVVVVDLRHVWIGKNIRQNLQFAALFGYQFAVGFAHPAAIPFVLVFPVFRKADAGLGFDVVKPRIFHAVARSPDVFTGNGAGVAADTFV